MIRKGHVDLPWGQVHYRVAGQGPPVVLLHDSPRSSVLHEPLIGALADRHTVIAPDTPGYGHSAPLATSSGPDIGDFAEALAATLDALSLPVCPVYGCHTGAKIVLEFAARYPGRASLAVMDGLSVPEQPVAESFIERYMAPFRITADGAYLAATWARARDLHRFFPWFSHTAEHRLAVEFPGAEALHRYALDLLMAGPHYADAYAAAMRYDPLPALARLETPAVVMCRRNDVLYGHLERLPADLPETVLRDPLPADANVWRNRLRELFARHGEYAAVPDLPPALRPGDGPPRSAYHQTETGGQWRLRFAGPDSAHPPVVLLPELPGGVATAAPLQDALAADRRTLALDAPGCGESAAGDEPSPATTAREMLRLLERLHWEQADILATFTAVPVALEMARHGGRAVRRLVFEGVVLAGAEDRKAIAEAYFPRLAPRWDGAHLLSAWTLLRDRELAWPWFARDISSIRRRTPDLDPWRLHRETIELLLQPQDYAALADAALRYDVAAALPALEHSALFICDPDDVRDEPTRRAAELCPRGMLAEVAPGVHARAGIIRAFLEPGPGA